MYKRTNPGFVYASAASTASPISFVPTLLVPRSTREMINLDAPLVSRTELEPGALLETLGELGVTGVLKVRQDEAQGPGLAAAQGGGAAVRLIVVGQDHGHHLVTGGLADA